MGAVSDTKPGQRAPRKRPDPAEGGPRPARPSPPPPDRGGAASRPLAVAGLVAAAWCVGIGLAVLVTITLVGWIAAPRTALGPGLPGVFRTAVNFWLVAHHAGFSLPGGRVGLLPLGLMVLPGALLYRGGAWMMRASRTARRSRAGVVHVALALAVPYAVLAALLALAAATPAVRPSAWQALTACLLLALVAGGLGAARALVASRGRRVRSGLGALLRLLPERPRSLVIGVLGALGVLLATGAVLVAASLAMNMSESTALYEELAPGVVGGALLFLVELVYLPNAVIWGLAYAVGTGFAVGTGTRVSPTGVLLEVVPSFPPLAALPDPGPAPAVSLVSLAAPFLAGVVAGTLTIRTLPTSSAEAAPLWGFASGALTGCATAVLAALSGGPLGGGRLTAMGPSPWRVGLMAALEVGIAAALTAWLYNWLILRRTPEGATPTPPSRRRKKKPAPPKTPKPAKPAKRAKRTGSAKPAEPPVPPAAPRTPDSPPRPRITPVLADPLEFEEAEPVLAARKPRRPRVRDQQDEPPTTPDPDPEPVSEEEEPPPPEPPKHREKPRDEPERIETRGGAIYVLRDDSPED